MAGFLLDTNVISELVKGAPEPRVLQFVSGRPAEALFLAAVTLGELMRGISALPAGRRRTRLLEWIRDDLQRQFAGRILPFDREAAIIWGTAMGDGDRRGRPRASADTQIAATAIRNNLALVTRNVADFGGLGLELIDPWSSS